MEEAEGIRLRSLLVVVLVRLVIDGLAPLKYKPGSLVKKSRGAINQISKAISVSRIHQ